MSKKEIAIHGGNREEIARKTGIKREQLIDFSANINPLPLPESAINAIQKGLKELPHYPDISYKKLKELIGNHYEIAPQNVLVGNGSTELLYLLPHCMKEGKACIVIPSYSDYTAAFQRAGEASFHLLKEEANFQLSFKELEESIKGCSKVVIGRPNNPTGNRCSLTTLLSFIEAHSDKEFLIDEAFADFLPQKEGEALLKEELENLILLRSLTKFYGIPGIRLGFAYAPDRVVEKMNALRLPWSVNCFAESLAFALLPESDFARKTRSFISSESVAMQRGLQKLPFLKVYPSDVNFLLCKLTCQQHNAKTVQEKLLSSNIMIRNCSNFKGLDGSFFRIAIKSEKENALLLNKLEDILSS